MRLINDNLKKAGYFNAALIVIAIVLKAICIGIGTTLSKIDSIICIIALMFGLLYSLNGYKKDAAKNYKVFMYLFFISNAFALTAPFAIKVDVLILVSNIIMFVLVFVLTFIKDLGVSKSTNLSMLILILTIIKFLYAVAKLGDSLSIYSGFSSLALSCVLCVFVSAKYADKESRGAK